MTIEPTPAEPEQLARLFHDTYETLAPEFGYRTREASAKPWAEVPEQNRALMVATCARVLDVLRAQQPAGPPTWRYVARDLREIVRQVQDAVHEVGLTPRLIEVEARFRQLAEDESRRGPDLSDPREPATAQETTADRPSVPAAGPTAPGEGDGQAPPPADAQRAAEAALGRLFSEFTDAVRGLLGAEDRLRASWADADEAGRHDLLTALYSAAQETAEVGLRLWGPAFITDPVTRTPLVHPKAGDVNPPTEPLLAAATLRGYADRHHAHPGGPTNLIQTLTIREAGGAILDYDACRSCSARLDEFGQCTGERPRLLEAARRIAAGEPAPPDPPRPGTEWTPEPVVREADRG